VSPPLDFESSASTNSAIQANWEGESRYIFFLSKNPVKNIASKVVGGAGTFNRIVTFAALKSQAFKQKPSG
jgi:hypothetical protein